MKTCLILLTVLLTLNSCNGQEKKASKKTYAVTKTEEQWKKELTSDQYEVLRKKGTEAPFTGEYYNHFEKGYYACMACKKPLFISETKFNTDCGWPSFDQAIKGSVVYKTDSSFGMERTEVMCANCGGHLGHVFDDGPANTTGKRFCTNSVSIEFVPKK